MFVTWEELSCQAKESKGTEVMQGFHSKMAVLNLPKGKWTKDYNSSEVSNIAGEFTELSLLVMKWMSVINKY